MSIRTKDLRDTWLGRLVCRVIMPAVWVAIDLDGLVSGDAKLRGQTFEGLAGLSYSSGFLALGIALALMANSPVLSRAWYCGATLFGVAVIAFVLGCLVAANVMFLGY